MARRVASNHYVATHNSPEGYLVRNGHSNVAYSTDGEDSHRAASEYMVRNWFIKILKRCYILYYTDSWKTFSNSGRIIAYVRATSMHPKYNKHPMV